MKEEAKVQEVVNEQEAVNEQDVAKELDVVDEEYSKFIVIPELFVSRKVVKRSGKEYSDYYVNGELRGISLQVRVRPGKDETGFIDVNAYNLLNVIFGDGSVAQFAIQTYKLRDRATGRISRGVTYFAYVKDVIEYHAPLRFETVSDKAIVSQMLELMNIKHELGLVL